jgi:hypothetical protein
MGSIERRLRALEDGSGVACPECGFIAGVPRASYAVEWADDHEDDEDSGPEFCSRCGEQTAIYVWWTPR